MAALPGSSDKSERPCQLTHLTNATPANAGRVRYLFECSPRRSAKATSRCDLYQLRFTDRTPTIAAVPLRKATCGGTLRLPGQMTFTPSPSRLPCLAQLRRRARRNSAPPSRTVGIEPTTHVAGPGRFARCSAAPGRPVTVTLASVAGRPYVSAMSVQRELRRRLRAERDAATPFAPCLPRLAKMPPVGRDWTNEIKHDGFRIIARRNGGTVRLITRNGYDFAGRFPLVAAAIAALPARSCVVDGEAIACDDDGLAVFDMVLYPQCVIR